MKRGFMHQTYIREVEGSKAVVLLIHGILSTPQHFQKITKKIPDHISIHNMLLNGHGKTLEDFAHTSMVDWKNQVHSTVDELSRKYDQIIIVAHSMGTLFALQTSMRYSDKIKAMFLISVPTKVWLKPVVIKNSFNIVYNRVKDYDVNGIHAKNAYSIDIDRKIWKYASWLPNYYGLAQEIYRTRNLLPHITVPCYSYITQKDEIVSPKSVKHISTNPHIKITNLDNSGHYHYSNTDISLFLSDFQEFCDKLD